MPKRSKAKKPGQKKTRSRNDSAKNAKDKADRLNERYEIPEIDIEKINIRSLKNKNHYGEKNPELFSKIFKDLKRGEQDSALVSIEKYISYFNESECNSDLANIYNLKGRVLRELGRIEEAQELYTKNLTMELENNLFFEYIATSNNTAICFQVLHEYETAFHFLNNSIKIAELLGDQELMGYTYVLIADNYHFLNHFQKADEYYRDSINMLKSYLHGENGFVINANIRRAENLAKFGKFDSAIDILTKYLEICYRNRWVLETQNILRDLFVFFSYLDRKEKSKMFTELYTGYLQKHRHLLKGVDNLMFESEQSFAKGDYTKCIEFADNIINNTTPYQTEIRKIAYDLKAESNEMMDKKIIAYNNYILVRLYSVLKYDYIFDKRTETKMKQILDEIEIPSEIQHGSLTKSELIIDTKSKNVHSDFNFSEFLKKSILSILNFLNKKVELEARLTLFGSSAESEIPPLVYTILILPDVLSETLKFRAYNITKPQQGFTYPETIKEENDYLEEIDFGTLLWDLFIDFDIVSIVIRNRMHNFHPKTNNPIRKYYGVRYINTESLDEPYYDSDAENSMIHYLSAKDLFESYVTNCENGTRVRPEMEVIYCNKDETEQIYGDKESDAISTLFR